MTCSARMLSRTISRAAELREMSSLWATAFMLIKMARVVSYTVVGVESFEDLVRIDKVWRRGGSIDQPAVLFPLELAVCVGGLNEKNQSPFAAYLVRTALRWG